MALAVLAVLFGLAACWFVGSALTAPSQAQVGAPPLDLQAEVVDWATQDGHRLHGWFVKGRPRQGAVILVHALRADRRSMVSRARFLMKAGYAVLLIDLQAHGENPGERITFGFRESRDVRAAVAYLRVRLPEERIGVIGSSLGGAASLLGQTVLPVDALVLEAVYTTIEEAVENRIAIRLGGVGRYLAPLLLWQVKFRLGVDPSSLAPITRIGGIAAPVLVIAGGKDRRTTIGQTRALFKTAPSPKSLWVIEGAGHLNFYGFAGKAYEGRVLGFLKAHLR